MANRHDPTDEVEEPEPFELDPEATFLVVGARAERALDTPCVDLELAGLVVYPEEQVDLDSLVEPEAMDKALRDGAVLAIRLPVPSVAAVVTALLQGALDLGPVAASRIAHAVGSALAGTPPTDRAAPSLLLPGPNGLLRPGP